MNERYLYKAKRIDDGQWVQGYLFRIWEKAYICWGMINNVPDMKEVDPSTICQCTGLRDRNGKLIWENDIVRRKILGCEVIGIVKWTDIGFTGFKLEVSNKNGSKSFYAIGQGTYDDDMSERCDDEVISNIFDKGSEDIGKGAKED